MRILLTLILSLACGAIAQAHAFLDHAEPKVGATVTESPPMVTIWFSEDVNPAKTAIAVFDAKGVEVDGKDSKVDPGNASRMAVSLPKLPVGTYRVEWHAVCRLGHHTNGKFTFTVGS